MMLGMAARASWRQRWRRRLATPQGQPLHQRRLFLLPTTFGLGWATLVLVLLLFGINYQNNLAYGLAFWLFAIALVALWRGWRNLHGIRVTLRPPQEVFAGGEARLGVHLQAPRARQGIQLRLGGDPVTCVIEHGEGQAQLTLPATRRGWQSLPLLRLHSDWPLGLVRVLAWVAPGDPLLVYPAPLDEASRTTRDEGEGQEERDFSGLRRYVPGDNPSRLAWKQWSRTGMLATKQFSRPPRRVLWLDYDEAPGDPERRLAWLCARVLAHHRAGDAYGLRLPGVTLAPDGGDAQRRRALRALALWGQTPEVAP